MVATAIIDGADRAVDDDGSTEKTLHLCSFVTLGVRVVKKTASKCKGETFS